MIIRQDRAGHEIKAFSVQLEVLINGHWRVAMRFDSAHGRPHKHVFYPNGFKYKEFMASNDNNEAFTQAQTVLKKSFQEIHERYRIVLERM